MGPLFSLNTMHPPPFLLLFLVQHDNAHPDQLSLSLSLPSRYFAPQYSNMGRCKVVSEAKPKNN